MSSKASNNKIKQKLIKLAVLLVIIATTIHIPEPIITYAENKQMGQNGQSGSGTIDPEDDYMNGEKENGSTGKLSYLYWAGSTERTGLLFYIVSTETGKPMSFKDLGLTHH